MTTERFPVAAAACPPHRIVIIGAGQAGGWAAHALRQQGHSGPIALIGDEPHPPHERPPLSKAVLAGTAAPESTWLMPAPVFEALALDWRPGVRVRRIDRAMRQVLLDDGTALPYDRLILCMGGRARRLALPGSGEVETHVLRSLQDAQRLAPALAPGRSLAVIGGGWIGLEVAATARQRGAEVTVLESGPRLCGRSVPAEVSAHLLALHQARGVRVVLGAGIEALARHADGRCALQLADGSVLACDTIVQGVGMQPNDELASEAGLDCAGGVLVDAECRTSDPHILAAGDVAVAPNAWTGQRLRLESWQNAQAQGMAAAHAALGLPVPPPPLPWFWSDQYGMNLQIHGIPRDTHQVVRRAGPAGASFSLFYLQDNVIQAAIGQNAARELRFARRLIEQRQPVDTALLADPQIPLPRL